MMTLTVLFLVSAQAFQAIPYYDPEGRTPTGYQEYAATQTIKPFEAQVAAPATSSGIRPMAGRYSHLVLVFINSGLYPQVQSDISTYLTDVQAAGYTTKLLTVTGGRPANLRSILVAYEDSGLVGTVMIGNLPVAWWEDSYNPNDGEDYPLDWYYTALNGTFTDADGDGLFDSYSGSVAPVIWLGRIDASRLTYGGEAEIIHNYFQRNHAFRTGQLSIPHRGLVLSNVFYTSDHGMSSMLSNVTNYGCNSSTSGYFYKQQLLQGYEFVHLVSHSSPWVNSFFDPTTTYGTGSVFNFEIPALGPHAVFYFLNACMCGRYTERDNLANWYALASPFGQVVLASAQTMYGIDDLSDLYGYLGADSCIGGAFEKWHQNYNSSFGDYNYDVFPAMTILGDPTLKVNRSCEQSPEPQPPVYKSGPKLDLTVYPVDTQNFVSGRPRIGCSQGKICLLYDSGRIVRSDNFFSEFNGTSFSRPESVAWHEYYDLFPCCCTDSSGRYWMVWQSFRDYDPDHIYEHFQLFSTYYNGSTWSSVNRIGPFGGYHDLQPAIAAGKGDTVWCAFQSWRNGQADIWASSEVHGGTWTTPVRLTTDSLEQLYPCVTTDRAGHPWVFWMSQTNGKWSIQGRKNQSGWQLTFTLDTVGENGEPRAATDALGRVWVVYHKWQGIQAHVYYTYYADSAWTAPQAVTSGSLNDILPDICALPDSSVWVTWQSDTGALSPSNIYCARYYSGTWDQPTDVTSDNAHSYDPSITADTSGNIWVAWASDRRGYWNIYAAKLPLQPSAVAVQPVIGRVGFGVKPNPFARAVSFSGPEHFSVDVFSVSGRKLAHVDAQSGKAIWVPGKLPYGVYVARLATPENQSDVKLLYMK